MNFKGNAGEWSEFYAALKLALDGELQGSDDKLEILPGMVLKILKVIRPDFQIQPSEDKVLFYSDPASNQSTEFPKVDLKNRIQKLYSLIRNTHKPVAAPELQSFMEKIGCHEVSAPSSQKKDIELTVLDNHIGGSINYGFSIKSYIAGAPTLLNASEATNLIYKVEGINDEDMENFNKIEGKNKLKVRMNYLKEKHASLIFSSYANQKFHDNLQLIDDGLPFLVAEILKTFFLTFKSPCKEILSKVAEQNPIGYPERTPNFYEIKFARFLRSVALGLKPSVEWDDSDEATGGYIVVKKSGEIIAFYIYNRKKFSEYLLNSTKLERASISRHHYMKIYKEDGIFKIKLNLQIRFK